MARKQTTPPAPPPPAKLLVRREEADRQIREQIERGRAIRELPTSSQEELGQARAQRKRWVGYVMEMLSRMFDTPTETQKFDASIASLVYFGGASDFRDTVQEDRRMVDRYVLALESLLDRLPLIPEPPGEDACAKQTAKESSRNNDVFVVHGWDDAAKQSVARFLEKLDLKAIILDEQPSAGRTIIEKFEHYAATVGYAVILLTPDDVGGPKDRPDEQQQRARENVLFELGYFVGSLGRGKVCLLRKGGVNIPSDLHGVVYIDLDAGGAWHLKLSSEMRAAGMQFDLARLIP